ncbi:restriction endonuclease subunit S [Dubosiella newyorkensis]|uniref:Type I restriction modification DNA specificity domain-containing protein n=1 Tax=Dubosiella newyorkensis TaxID=1862672 RepID=A0A1U7NM30_9FIRM|nr:restriction endonuclease subunit S [Dubosiella newyorkensis]OLU46187.1 hypothetical protein BO225_06825 [Dubosiella newyorkensis]
MSEKEQKKDKKANVPKLRFPGFTEPWEQRRLGEAFINLQNNTLSRAELSSGEGKVKNVHYGDLLVIFSEVLNVKKEELPTIKDESIISKYKESFLKNGDIVMADTAEDETVGKCTEIEGLTEEIVISGLHTIPYRPQSKFAPRYLGYYLNSAYYHDQLLPLTQGIKVSSISKTSLKSTYISYPKSLVEQGKIGNFFNYLDHLITLHQRKLDDLKKLKKGLLQKMFPKNGEKVPELRFPGFKNDWEQRRFGEIVDKYVDAVNTPHEGYNRLGIRSHAKGTFHSYVKKGNELETAQMYRVAEGKFIVNITFGWEHAVAITDINDAGKLVSHRFPQFSFHDDMVPDFFRYVIIDERFRHHLWLSSPGGAGRNRVLKIEEMLKYLMIYPSKQEQERIALFFNQIDHLITLHQRKLDHLKELKKGLLQQMFV